MKMLVQIFQNTRPLFIFIISLLIFQRWLLTDSQYIFLGRCLKFPVQPNFNLENYMGQWYTIEQFANFDISYCINSVYETNDEVVTTFGNDSFLMSTSRLTPLGWTTDLDVAVKSEPAKYLIRSPSMTDTNTDNLVPYWILSTDYQNYSLVWQCRPVTAFNLQIVRFLSRTQTANRYVRDKVYNRMRKLGINTRLMTRSYSQFCPSARL